MLDFVMLAQQCAPTVAVQTMAAIVKTESGFQPLAIGINGGARLERQPASKDEAVVTAKWLISHGYNIDMGLGQVNSANLARIGLTVEDAFDACRNLGASAQILTDNYRAARPRLGNDQAALHAAFSTYNTGSPTRGFSNGYVKRVVANGSAAEAFRAETGVRPISLVKNSVGTVRAAQATGAQTALPAHPVKTKAAPVRLTASNDDESEILKLMADVPEAHGAERMAPGSTRTDPSVYAREAQSIDVYR